MKYCCLILLLTFSTCVFSQQPQQLSTKNKKAIQLYQEAEALGKARKFHEAMARLRTAIDKDPNFVEAYLKMGSCYKILGNNEESKKYIFKAVELKPDSRDMAAAYMAAGEFHFNDGSYEEARNYFQKTLSYSNDKRLLEACQQYVAKADFGIEAKKSPYTLQPVPMSPVINRFYIHGYPVLTADQQTLIYYKRDGIKLDDDEDIVMSRKVNGEWTAPVSISDNINSQFNEGAPTISADGKVLVFTSCNRLDGIGACDLYISYREGNEWSKPVNMGPRVNSNVWDSEPTITADGKTIYFASERRGGLGKEDIWYTTMNEKGEWTQAKNLGRPVNTEGREVSPFIHANGKTLYFSSTHHIGMGGLDIFSSTREDSTWSVPKNLGYPLNGPSNDATMFVTPDFKKGYYTVYEKKDMKVSKALLYEFDMPLELQEKKKSTYAKGVVYDAETRKPIAANIELIDLKSNVREQWVNSDPMNGEYLIVLTEGAEYALYASGDAYLFKSVFFDYNNLKAFDPLTLDIYLDPIKSGSKVVLNNLFFASGSFTLEEKSKTELDKITLFLKKNSKVNLEFGGHTDDIGSDKDNLILSEKRAKAVYDYLVQSGVAASRLKYKGYGKSQPLVPNTSEENRQMNRRIEFKIL